MKLIIASVLLVVVSAQAAAFWGWSDTGNRGYGNGYGNGLVDGVADADADFKFDFNFTASMRAEGRGYGNGYGDAYGRGHGYNAHIPYYGAPYGYVPPQVVAPVAVE